jgi:preprotein translocase subunit SecG
VSILFYIFLSFFLLLSIVLCFSILVQESKSMGLGASFGGDPGSSLFGTSTAEVLKKFTATLGVIFAVFCIVLSAWSSMGINAISKKAATTTEEISPEQ